MKVPGVVSPSPSVILSWTTLFSSIIISSSSSSGISKTGVAPETVTVWTNTLSATTTVKRTILVLESELTVSEVKLGKKALITGPVLSSFIIVSVTEEVDVFPFVSVAEKV